MKPASELSFSEGTGLFAGLTTFDGLNVNIETTREDDVTYARFTANFDAALVVADEEPKSESADESGASPEVTEQAPTTETAKRDTAEQEARALSARWQNWAYALPDYIVTDLEKTNTDLIKQDDDSAQLEGEGSAEP